VPFRPTVGDALQHAVAHWPDHDFVVTPERRMTYAEAEGESGRLARRMLAAGMGKGTRVGLLFPYGQD
jgi:acyl-CoA synthetase (AMP-forming)/AMP-acid ligase II